MDDEYYENLQRVNPGFGRPKFSRRELIDILIAVLTLSFAFTLLYRNNDTILFYFGYMLGENLEYVGLFGLCFALVVMSFLFHEFGHKFVAQKFGLWSEFRMWPMGLVLTLVTSLFGFLFASPGAVYISGPMDMEKNGKISIAGPVVNIVLAAIGILGCFTINHSGWVIFFLLLGNLNAFLAVFNMLPIPPLDGSKIIAWNKVLWVATIAVAAIELFVMLRCLPTLYIF
jgi:Zn-dependent protease